MLNSSSWVPTCARLLIILSCLVHLANTVSVSDADAFRDALLDGSTSSISLQGPVVLDPASFATVHLDRALVIAAATPAAYLDFGSAQQALIIIDPGGNLTLLGLQLANLIPAQPLPPTQASSRMPLSAVGSSGSSAHLVISRCMLLVDGPLSNLTDSLPFWAARQQADDLRAPQTSALSAGLLSALGQSPAASDLQSTQQFVALISTYNSSSHGGSSSSSIQITDSVVVFNTDGCFTLGTQYLAWDSMSLLQALQPPRPTNGGSSSALQVLLLTDITLSPAHWTPSPAYASSIPSVQISSCGSTTTDEGSGGSGSRPTIMDFNHLPGVFLLQPGATLNFSQGLVLANTAAVSQIYPRRAQQPQLSWPYSNLSSSALTLLTLGSVDVSRGGRLVLRDVAVGVPDAAATKAAMQQVTGAGGSKPSLQAAAAGGQGTGSSAFVVLTWDTSLAGWSLGGTSAVVPAEDGSRLFMQDVTVLQTPNLCTQQQQQQQQSSNTAVVASEADLLAALTDGDISTLLVAADIKLYSNRWQGLERVKLRRPLVVHGCSSSAVRPVVLDFSDLQGTAMFLISSPVTLSGDLVLRGVPDHPDIPGSWVLLPLLQLTDNGSLTFQGVQLQGYSQPNMQQLESLATGRPSVAEINSSAVLMHWMTLPRSAVQQLGTATNGGSSSGINRLQGNRLRSLLQLPGSGSSNSSRSATTVAETVAGGAYYAWVGTQLSWGDRAAAAPKQGLTDPGAIAAVVLGTVLGLVLILAVVALLLQRRCCRRPQQQQWGVMDGSGKGSGSCWPLCCGQGPEHQLLPPGLPSSYLEYNHSWGPGMGPQVPPGASVLASFGSAQRVFGDGSEQAGLAYNSAGSDMGTGVQNGPNAAAAAAAMMVHTSPNSATTGTSFRAPVGQSGEGNLYKLIQHHQQQQQQGLEVQRAGPSFSTTAAAMAAAAAAAVEHVHDGTQSSAGEDAGGQLGAAGGGQHKQQVFEAARRQLGATAGDLARSDALVLEAVLGEGSFGKVFRGYWKGTLVAVKTMMFPAAMSGKEKREKMAIMETAISASLSHPNIVQMYTYYLRPVLVGHEATLTGGAAEEAARLDNSSVGDSTMNAAFLNEGLSDSVHSWEVQLVLEYCDKGSLRALLNKQGTLLQADGRRDIVLILDTALDVARAMVHLHSENIIHSDLKARNILLKSSGGAEGRPFVAKVADFGLSMRIDPDATHVSNVYQGTMTHMAPEVMLRGKLSRQSDVYAFGVLLWELYSGGHAFKGIPRALLGHEVAHQQRRPQFPDDCPFDFQLLACRCWESDASIRPSFSEILQELLRMRERMAAAAAAEKAAADAQSATDAAAADGTGAAAATGRPQSEPLQGHTGAVTAPPAATVSDPVHGVKTAAGTAAAAGALAAAAAAVAAAAAAGAGDSAAAAEGQAAAVDLDIAAVCEQQQEQQQQRLQQPSPNGVVGPSGRLQTHSIPLLLPVPDQPQQQQQQVAAAGQPSLCPDSPAMELLLQQQHEQAAVGPDLDPQEHHHHQQQQGFNADRAQAARRASDSLPHAAMLDDLMLQVSLTGGSSMCAGGLVHAPQHPQQQHPGQHSCPDNIAEQRKITPGAAAAAAAGVGVGAAGAAAAAAAAANGGRPGPSMSSPLPYITPADYQHHHQQHYHQQQLQYLQDEQQQQQQQHERSEYLEESSSFSACGPGVMLYGATRHRQTKAWGYGGSTATASDEAKASSSAAAAAAAGVAVVGAAGVAGAASKQPSLQADGDRSSEHDQGLQQAKAAGAVTAVAADQQQQQQQVVEGLAQVQQAQGEAAEARTGPAAAAAAVPAEEAEAGQQAEAASPAHSRTQRFGARLQMLSASARNLLRVGGKQQAVGTAADASAARASSSVAMPPSAAPGVAAEQGQGVAALSAVLPPQQVALAQPLSPAAAAPMGSAATGMPTDASGVSRHHSTSPFAAQGLLPQQDVQQDVQQSDRSQTPPTAAAAAQAGPGQRPAPVVVPPVVVPPVLAPAAEALAAAVAAAAGAAGLAVGVGTAAAGEPSPADAGGISAPLQSAPCQASVSGGSRSVTVYSSGDSSSARGSTYDAEQDSSSGDEAAEQQRKLDETEAAIAAVMSLKASLAKQAFAGGISRQRSASTAVPAARLSVDSGLAAATATATAAAAAAGATGPNRGLPYRHSVDVLVGSNAASAATAAAGTSNRPNAISVPAGPTAAPGVGSRPPPSPGPAAVRSAFPVTSAAAPQQQQQQFGMTHLGAGKVASWQQAVVDTAPGAAAAVAAAAAAALSQGQAASAAAGGQQQQQQHPTLPLHLIAQQLSTLEAQVPLAARAGSSFRDMSQRRLSADAATVETATAAAAAAAAAVQDANRRPWHTGLSNLATQLLQPALAGPRSPKHQQQQHQQQQQQQQSRMAPRWSPRTSWKPPVRKTVSASQLGANRGAGLAGFTPASTPGPSGVLPGLHNAPSQPLPLQPLPPVLFEESTLSMTGQGTATATGKVSIQAPNAGQVGAAAPGSGVTGRASMHLPMTAAQQQQQRLQQQRMSLQLPLQLGGLQQGGVEAQRPQQLGLSGLDPTQLQLLAQIADAARAQVSPLSIVGDMQADADSLATQQRWRSAPNAAAPSEPLSVLRPQTSQQQQQYQSMRPRPQHVASFNQPGVRQYGISAAAMAATAAGAGAAAATSAAAGGGVPRSPTPGVTGAGRQSPGGRPRRSSAPVVTPLQMREQQLWQLHQQQQQQ